MQEQGFGVHLLLSASKGTRLGLAFLAWFASSVLLSPKLTVNTQRCTQTKQARGRCSHKQISNWELQLPLRRLTVSRTECKYQRGEVTMMPGWVSFCVSCELWSLQRLKQHHFQISISARVSHAVPAPGAKWTFPTMQSGLHVWEAMQRWGGQMTREMIQIWNIISLEFLSERGLFFVLFLFLQHARMTSLFSLFGDAFAFSVRTTRVHLTQSLHTPAWFRVLSKHLEGLARLSSYQDLPKLGDR